MNIKMTRTITISYDGTGEQYCSNANQILLNCTGEGLDNWDTGDATGAIHTLLDMGHDVDDTISFEDGTRMHFTYEDSFYSYDGTWGN